ncbi:hypothetical protein BN946_scf184895.g10 [Trametes cinnabarina]|uniref:Vacuolar protein sorting-associated protein 41 n=1 Tax=Pycnoporus cinnabarinus TaxID=5643 RepID=A0A060SLF4_PYCCI|nr:hypothetical protein BN946_scf184895.g10 [Trametes cinnabarina]
MSEASAEDDNASERGNAETAGAASEAEEEGDEEEEVDEDDDEGEDEDEEPALKYERLGGIAHQLLQKDSASMLAYANQRLALGTHAGMLHILDLSGQHIKSLRAHSASVLDISIDLTGDFIATASIDAHDHLFGSLPSGQVVVHSLSGAETPSFNMKRPVRTVALEPNFAKSSTRSLVSGGMAGNLVLHEKGWLGYKETILHSGEGPIWQVRWRDNLIAWANDLGVKIYDTHSQTRITYIDRPADSPRADLFKCTLHWQDESTLLIGWADQIKVARIRARPRKTATASSLPPLLVEITAVFQLDCMIAGIVPHPLSQSASTSNALMSDALKKSNGTGSVRSTAPALTAFLVLAYTPPDMSLLTGNEAVSDPAEQARKQAERPELRIISRAGEELAADALGITNYERWNCNDYVLVDIDAAPVKAAVPGTAGERYYIVLSPKDLVVVKPRDWRDHVAWLVERQRYEEALEEIERRSGEADAAGEKDTIDAVQIGQKYIEHLISEGDFVKAARLCPKVCGQDTKRWEDWIFLFAQKHQLQASGADRALLQTIKTWPKGIYDISAVIVAVQSELEKAPSTSTKKPSGPDTVILMECLAELYTLNRQPGKALPYFLRLRRPNVFDLIKENNLFTDVQDQALLLVEFDQELREKRKQAGEDIDTDPVSAITLLVSHIHAIPVKLYAEYAPRRLIDFLRASNYYNLEQAYNVCNERDLVPEMVFLLGRMGNNKKALYLIIERLGDVSRAIEFAKEQHDDDLWEDLLRYSETRPAFIRGLLENVGAEIDPIRLIRRIKNGLEIPGLKGALIKILHDFNLQVSLLEGCQTIMNGDCADLVFKLHRNQTSGFFLSAKTPCPICNKPISQPPNGLILLFLCRHVVHAHCVDRGDELPHQPDSTLVDMGIGGQPGLSGKIAL